MRPPQRKLCARAPLLDGLDDRSLDLRSLQMRDSGQGLRLIFQLLYDRIGDLRHLLRLRRDEDRRSILAGNSGRVRLARRIQSQLGRQIRLRDDRLRLLGQLLAV